MPSSEAEARLELISEQALPAVETASSTFRVTAGRPPRRWRDIPWSRLAVPFLTLGLVGVSLALFVRTLTIDPEIRNDFLTGNILEPRQRASLLLSLLWGSMLGFGGGILVLAVKRARAVDFLERLAVLLAPLIVLCVVPALFNVKFGHLSQLGYLVLLSVFVLTCEPLLRRSFAAIGATHAMQRGLDPWSLVLPARASRILLFSLVVVASAAYAAYVGYFTILHHHRLGTTAFDLGIYDNLIFNAMHGHPFKASVLFGPAGGNNLASHAEFAVILFVPFYAIHPGPETMLIIQAVLLGFAAVPLYLFASTSLPRAAAAVVALAYLLFAPLHGPNFYDFHWLPLAIFFHFWLYYAIATRKNWLIAIMLVVLFAIREDVAVGLAALGVFLLITRIRPRLGVILAVLSVTWFAIDRFVIMPLAGAWYFQNFYAALFADGVSTFGSIFKTILTNPLYFLTTFAQEAKLIYVLHMFAPLAFLPFRRLPFLILALPGVFFTIMTSGYGPTVAISFQYTTHWIPYLFLTTVLALIAISREDGGVRGVNGVSGRRAALVTMAIAMLAHSYNFGAILQRETFIGGFSKIEFKMTPSEQRRYQELKELLAMIPPKASVAATEQETPHISTRKIAYPLRWPPGPVDFILVGRSHIGDLSRAPLNAALADPAAYGLLAERGDELFLFKRGHKSPQTQLARVKLGVP